MWKEMWQHLIDIIILKIPRGISMNLSSYYPAFEEAKSLNVIIMQNFHDYTMTFLILIFVFLLCMLMSKIICKFTSLTLLASRLLELIWTIFPMMILFLIAMPSIFYLYVMDMSLNPTATVKIFAAQWYWIYEYQTPFSKDISINSYMLSDSDLKNSPPMLGAWRLLETDNRGFLPYGVECRILVTAQDVIHSFSIPGLGLKVDAIPGRLNSTTVLSYIPGVFYGQCSEICGIGHSFMPISIEFVSYKDYLSLFYNSLN